ncbi:MAG: threonine synthase [Coriobacteriales bacterium]|jgi:threonine synthase|nr:threonine synthase [Coriobacteriales bacterium]
MYTNTYIDTRSVVATDAHRGEPPVFSDVILEGIAPSGGLFVPKVLPRLSLQEVIDLATMPYFEQAALIFERFGVDLPPSQIRALCHQAYGNNFDDPAIAPLHSLSADTHVLELWHGPTLAFKDMALQCMPLFFSAAVAKQRREQAGRAHDMAGLDYLVLVATSGDTGKAALEGFAGREFTNIIVFYPQGGISELQQRQMLSQSGVNLGVFALEGNFDSCQAAVKGAFANQDFRRQLAHHFGLQLSSANSINWGRLLPQIVYYVSAYSHMVQEGCLQAGSPLDVCVPTGNFGNILAAYYAAEIGTPIERLLCASNSNRVLSDFINTGTYDVSAREFVITPSPSMDILVSSNLERQLFELTGRDGARINQWMEALSKKRRFKVDRATFAALRKRFLADWVSIDETLQTIAAVYERYDYLMDPHTAVGYKVAERLRGPNPLLLAATAHWSKFGADVYRGLTGLAPAAPLPKPLANLNAVELDAYIAEHFKHAGDLPASISALAKVDLNSEQLIAGGTSAVEKTIVDWLRQKKN